ncbi:MAG: right-handed parallel beta-helix repeat-containing protein [Bacteroidales bacterium]|nr:right-handed parallel beta-helix repeat-containing protein [Bacteroidales bacterium]
MKILQALLLFFLTVLTGYAQKYYISNSGDDSSEGTSPSTAWATINKVNNSSFQPGDSIFFERGGLWRAALVMASSGSEDSYIYFGPYGEGPRPKIYGSNITSWTSHSGNVWVSENTFENPGESYAGGVFFENNDTTLWGQAQKNQVSDLASDRDWAWFEGRIYIYSSSDPAAAYTSVEVSQRNFCVYYDEQDYLAFDSLDIRYSRLAGFKERWPFNAEIGLEIKNCHVSHIGIKGSRVGYGIEFWHSESHVHNNIIHDCGRRATSTRPQDAPTGRLHDVLIEYNTIYNCYHAGIGIAAETDASFDNLTIRYNLIYETEEQHTDAPEGYAMAHIGITGKENANRFTNVMVYANISVSPTQPSIILNHAQDIKIYNNTIYGSNQNSDEFNGQLYMQGTTNNCEVKNNIFYNNNDFSRNNFWPCIYSTYETDLASIDVDYNLYYIEDENNMLFNLQGSGGAYYMNDWNSYLNTIGWDAHSQEPQDPMFVSPTDYRLKDGSPAIGEGLDVGLEYDFAGNFFNSPPSLGAIEGNVVSVPGLLPDNGIEIYPNPTAGDFHVVLPDYLSYGEVRLRVYNLSGTLVHDSVREAVQKDLYYRLNLATGIYIVEISKDRAIIATGKIVIGKDPNPRL